MATYNISTLIGDKELCKSLIAEGIVLIDQSGTIEDIDFKNESMRSNHIKAFEMLYAAGGDELFKAILAEGKTSLADSPDAAKVGVVEINNAPGYYLKSNVSALVAFLSVLNGVKHIPNSEECITVQTFEDDEIEDDGFFDEYEADEEQSELPYINERRNVSVAKFNDIYRFYDEEQKETISFECVNGDEVVTVSDMYYAEPIMYKEVVGYDIEHDDEPIYAQSKRGYRYQLEKDGKWGYVSDNFVCFVYPVYEGIVAGCDGTVFAWIKEFNDSISVCSAGSFSYVNSENYVTHEYTLMTVPPLYTMNYDMSWYRMVGESFIPSEKSKRESLWNTDTVLYIPDESVFNGVFKVKTKTKTSGNSGFDWINSGGETVQQFKAYCNDGLLYLKGDYDYELKHDLKPIPSKSLTAEGCLECFENELSKQYEAVEHIKDDLYVVHKEGYYAIAEIDFKYGRRIKSYLTPYAFTNIDLTDKVYDVVKLERFGKKGAFDLESRKYVVPCEYDYVEYYASFLNSNGVGQFAVKKMDFSGVISIDGKWDKPLHRQTEE